MTLLYSDVLCHVAIIKTMFDIIESETLSKSQFLCYIKGQITALSIKAY